MCACVGESGVEAGKLEKVHKREENRAHDMDMDRGGGGGMREDNWLRMYANMTSKPVTLDTSWSK